jgi:hypothetical protein
MSGQICIISTKNLGLKMQPMKVKDKRNVVVYSDSDWVAIQKLEEE